MQGYGAGRALTAFWDDGLARRVSRTCAMAAGSPVSNVMTRATWTWLALKKGVMKTPCICHECVMEAIQQ
jgi:hypothetical protein